MRRLTRRHSISNKHAGFNVSKKKIERAPAHTFLRTNEHISIGIARIHHQYFQYLYASCARLSQNKIVYQKPGVNAEVNAICRTNSTVCNCGSDSYMYYTLTHMAWFI